jgi:Receptor family ligand binding region
MNRKRRLGATAICFSMAAASHGAALEEVTAARGDFPEGLTLPMNCCSQNLQGRQMQSASTGSPYLFDQLRTSLSVQNDSAASIVTSPNSSIFEATLPLFQNATTTYRLAEIKTFIAFSNGTDALPNNFNDAFAVFLALHHFNNMQESGHPVLGDYITNHTNLLGCNVKLTMELIDSQYSPTKTTLEFTSLSQRKTSIQSPPATAVVGAQRSAETLPLAVLTAVKGIPQVSASATSLSFDTKEQFPLFGRTVTSTKGEAAAAARFFQSIGSTHVVILFVTVSCRGKKHRRSSSQELICFRCCEPHIILSWSSARTPTAPRCKSRSETSA